MKYLALILVLFNCLPSLALSKEEENRVACKVIADKGCFESCKSFLGVTSNLSDEALARMKISRNESYKHDHKNYTDCYAKEFKDSFDKCLERLKSIN